MTNVAEEEGSGEMPIRLDVLIIGGGIMGLWLLMELHEAGYAVLLLERGELGGEQTCHSHVYIHQGYLYHVIALAARLKDTHARWQVWLEKHAPQRAVTPSYFGFRSAADADLRTKLWNDERLRLPYTQVSPDTVPALRGGSIKILLQTPEITLEGTSLVRELSHSVEEFIGRIEAVRSIRVNTLTKEVEEVEVSVPGGRRLTFQPKALVLAAGAGNQALLDNTAGDNSALRQQVGGAQQIRKSFMLVIKSAKGDLDPLTGVFPSYDGLFLVSRDLGDETVWLVSNHHGPPLTSVADWLKYDERWWLPGVWAALQEIAPRAFTHLERLQWGIYAAPKAEGRHGRGNPHISGG